MKKITAQTARNITREVQGRASNTKEVKFAIEHVEGEIEEAANKGLESVIVALSDLCVDQYTAPKFAMPSESTILCIKGELCSRGFDVVETHLNNYGKSVRHFIISW